ncbi:GntR family transcriptional regulator [Hirschia maritima]|uniref:GntR family transcriptional regulator n=1 Tax=Hirschia maritima TaxID=1121961 RepID=UPI00036A52D3|nr:GntR family transcriptional regulator [Hirschia maritima]
MTKDTLPRYKQLADSLRSKITSGELNAGDAFPTEMEICETYSVSRHTARDALRILSEERLILRRRRAGTVVADISAPAFAQPIGDFDSVLQYAREAKLIIFDDGLCDEYGLERLKLHGDYIWFQGIRAIGDEPPQAITNVVIRADVAPPDRNTINQLSGPISEWIEQSKGLSVQNVSQTMEAVALTTEQAKLLEVKPQSPALRTIRRYSDTKKETFLVSESLHPAGRFAYEINLNRTNG